jgi:hypothetical protein
MQVSAEIRWFWPELEPTDLAGWFQDKAVHNFSPGGGETRVDLYLVDRDQLELGVKSRGGKNGIEVKGLVSPSEPGLQLSPFTGPIEIWTKWTSNSLDLNSRQTTRIEKRRWLRKFETSSERTREIELDREERPATGEPPPQSGCNVEFTALTLDGHRPWWTLGFEAFGSLAGVTQSLQAVASLLVSRHPPPTPQGLRCSYPQWLTRCIWPRPAKAQKATIVAARPIKAQVGPFQITGYLYMATPAADSFIEGTITLDDLFERRILVFLDDQPVCFEVEVGMEELSACIKFNPVSWEFVGMARRYPSQTQTVEPEVWKPIVAML